MFVFPRRTIQECLRKLEDVLPSDQVAALARRLNLPGTDRIAAMWEVVLLSGLAGQGLRSSETPLGDGKRPDFSLKIYSEKRNFDIVGDVTTISDKGLHQKSAVDYFTRQLAKAARKAGLDPNKINYDIRGENHGEYGDARIYLKMPPKSEIPDFIRKFVVPFFDYIVRFAEGPAEMRVCDADTEIKIGFDPMQRFMSGGHQSYVVAASLEKNPVFSALRGKSRQLKSAPQTTLKAVVLCDGGCDSLSRFDGGLSPGTYGANRIVDHFLRKSTSIDLVFIVSVERVRPYDVRSELQLKVAYAFKRNGSSPIDEGAQKTIIATIERALRCLPPPCAMPNVAAARCLSDECLIGKLGAYEMSDSRVKISKLSLLRLLSGQISYADFLKSHEWYDDPKRGFDMNPFFRMFNTGRKLDTVEVIPCEDDDDFVEFVFGGFDAGYGPFRTGADEGRE